MEQSILKSTKKILQIGIDDDSFDLDIMTHINSAFSTLHDLGIGPIAGFVIDDDSEVWDDFVNEKVQQSRVKTFVWLTTKLAFDSPAVVHLLNATEEQLKEVTWRLNVKREETEWVDPNQPEVDVDEIPVVLDGGDADGVS
jgi:hypothetical protein